MSAVESKVECPYCQGHVAFPPQMSGQVIACPHCGQQMELPAPAKNTGQPREPLYRIRISNDEIGPYPLAGLRGLLADGVITLATPIVPVEGGDWMPLGDLLPPEKSAQTSSRPPPPPSTASRQPPPPPCSGRATPPPPSRASASSAPPPPRSRPPPPPAPRRPSPSGQPAPYQSSTVATPTQPKPKQNPFVVGCAVIGGIFGLIMLIFAVDIATESPEKSAKRQTESDRNMAHVMAGVYLEERYSGLKSVSHYRDSVVIQNGSTFSVAVKADGVNAFGAPVRNTFGVELEKVGENWVLKKIVQE